MGDTGLIPNTAAFIPFYPLTYWVERRLRGHA
jgi:hypothetical protein